MSRPFYFITHPEVTIQPDVPIPEWPLSRRGRARMQRGLAQPWVRDITSIYASTERKAVEAAQILAAHLALPFQSIPALGENDRSSTGYLPRAEFERVADAFFAQPAQSVRGWERAIDAQSRIVGAVRALGDADRTRGPWPSSRTARSGRCSTASSTASASTGATTSRATAAATTFASR